MELANQTRVTEEDEKRIRAYVRLERETSERVHQAYRGAWIWAVAGFLATCLVPAVSNAPEGNPPMWAIWIIVFFIVSGVLYFQVTRKTAWSECSNAHEHLYSGEEGEYRRAMLDRQSELERELKL